MLRPSDGSGRPTAAHLAPRADVARYLEHYWSLAWSVPAPAHRAVVAHPAIHVTVEDGDGPLHGHRLPAVLVHGVVRRTFEVELPRRGWVFGARFRPGGFRAMTGIDASSLTDRVVRLETLVDDADELLDAVLAAGDYAAKTSAMDAWFGARLPGDPDPDYTRVLRVVAGLLADRTLHRAEDVAAAHGMSLRSLQRLCKRFVGVGPKWLLTRYRLHDAIAAIDEDPDVDLADLAASLGWFDQAHFTREFTALVGVSPQTYRARPR